MIGKWTRTEGKDAGTVGDRPKIDGVTLRWEIDDNPDLSWLKKEPDDEYYAADKARLDAYDRGDWHMEGVTAVAVVSYPIGQGSRRMEEFSSGGLWGIENDRTQYHEEQVSLQELHDLKEHLERFGVDTANFWELAPVKPKAAPVTADELSVARMGDGDGRPTLVIRDGRLMMYVGIGWIDIGEATPADQRILPFVVDL